MTDHSTDRFGPQPFLHAVTMNPHQAKKVDVKVSAAFYFIISHDNMAILESGMGKR